ncbi:HAD family hydrolase [Nitrospira lenta]|uniref:Putative Hydrolase, HAD-superfamily n=1 Tax=Nitrospira lenta TaxID=1436998 RepID=A0A330L4T8_9BACT|nr:HAD family phosphatase [Nitrospira lenta]SPP64821.1 putative Hydrolase, HAD-superfamily [Nitrospira lenta]
MIRAILFDFNGVLADDETVHVECFCQALHEFGLALSTTEYYGTYLGMDERSCTALLIAAREGQSDAELVRQIQDRKAELFRCHPAAQKPALFPGVIEFVQAARPLCRLAVASGGRREQIDRALHGTAIERAFERIVSADDCPVGKPDPAIYLLTLTRLNDGVRPLLRPDECLVIEDSKAGIRAARAAGMSVLGLATTYQADELREADRVLPSLVAVDPGILLRQFS